MTPDFLNRRIAHCRRLVAMRVLPKEALLILDSLAFAQGREADSDTLICSYSDLTEALHIARKTVSKCLRLLIGVGLLHRRHRHELVDWRSGRRWVQRENEYRFVPDDCREFPKLPVKESKKKRKRRTEEVFGHNSTDATLARQALAKVREILLQRQRAALTSRAAAPAQSTAAAAR